MKARVSILWSRGKRRAKPKIVEGRTDYSGQGELAVFLEDSLVAGTMAMARLLFIDADGFRLAGVEDCGLGRDGPRYYQEWYIVPMPETEP